MVADWGLSSLYAMPQNRSLRPQYDVLREQREGAEPDSEHVGEDISEGRNITSVGLSHVLDTATEERIDKSGSLHTPYNAV